MNNHIIETAERIVIDYANCSGRESENRAMFRELVMRHLTRLSELLEENRVCENHRQKISEAFDDGVESQINTVRQGIKRWAKMIIDTQHLPEYDWTGEDEIEASILSYIEGHDLKGTKHSEDTTIETPEGTLHLTCLGLDCPERKSRCCGGTRRAASEPELMLGVPEFFCGICGKKYEGGKCDADKEPTVNYSTLETSVASFNAVIKNVLSNGGVITKITVNYEPALENKQNLPVPGNEQKGE